MVREIQKSYFFLHCKSKNKISLKSFHLMVKEVQIIQILFSLVQEYQNGKTFAQKTINLINFYGQDQGNPKI